MELVNPFRILLINLLLSTTAVFSKYDIIMEPIHYNIKLMPRMDDDSFHGESNVTINIYNSTQNITISSEKLNIIEFVLINELRGSKNNDGKSVVHTPEDHCYNYKTNIYRFYFYNAIAPGNYTMNMKFIGTIAEDFRIFHKDEQGFGSRILATNFQRTGIQQIFPCLGAPALMTTFNISVRHHKYYTILSNMPVREKHRDNNEMMWTHFQTTPVMLTYHVAVVMLLNYDYNYDLYQTNQTVNVWFRSHSLQYIKFVHNTAKNIMEYLDKWKFSEKIPKVDFIGIPQLEEHNIVIPGLIFYRERDIMYDKESVSQQREVAYLIVQKLIQERFYNKFGTSQTDLWLNGVIRFLGAYILDKIFQIHFMDLFVVQIQHDSLHLDINYNMTPLTTQVDKYSSIFQYLIAPCIIRMLQHVMTEEVFLNGIRIFLEDDTNQKDFWTCLQDALNILERFIYKSSLQVTWIKTWAMGYPVQINVISNKEGYNNETLIKIWQDRTPNENEWWIPVTYTTQESPDFSKSWFDDDEWLSQGRETLYSRINATGWIIVNLQQSGYYRVYYDYKNWQALVNYLDSKEYTKIHVLNRAQIIDDAFHFVLGNQLDIPVFLNLIKYLSRETNYIAWYPMIRALQNMSTFFPLPEKKVDFIKEKLQGILNKLLNQIGYRQKTDMDDLTKCLIEEATKWACVIGSTNCKNIATIKLRWDLENSNQGHSPHFRRLSPHWKEWTYCKGLMAANASIWYKVLEKYKEKYDNVLLEYLTCSENPDFINNYLSILQYKSVNISDHICIKTVHLIFSKHARRNIVLKYIIENFTLLRFRQINVLTTIAIIINHVYSEEQIEMLRRFVVYKLTERPLFMHDQDEEHMGKLINATKTGKVVQGRHFVYILDKMKERLSQIANQIRYLDTLNLDE